MKRLYFLICILICSISCNNDLNIFYTNELFDNIPNKKGFEYIVIIPNAGCPGCITNAEEFLKKKKNSTKYYFILTNYTSTKSLKLKLGTDVMSYRNVFLDSLNKFYAANSKESIYPISLQIKEDQIQYVFAGMPDELNEE